MPILQRDRMHFEARSVENSVEIDCLFASLCAFMMIQPGMRLPGSTPADRSSTIAANFASGSILLEEALRLRKSYDYIENPTLATVITSFFVFGCYFGLDRHNTAWFHHREATTLAQIMGMQEETNYLTGDFIECSRRRRLYWLLFITESIEHMLYKDIATIELPTLDEDPSDTVAISGFIHLVNLFRPFDDTFVGLWNKSRADCSTAWLAQLQTQLADALPRDLEGTESQAADLRTSQQWLRTMVWQLSITNGYLSSTSTDAALTFKYPIEISRGLVTVTSQFSQHSMEVHGIGLIEKLFDVTCTLIDVMACVPIGVNRLLTGPRDYLNQLLTLISTLRGGDNRFLPLLLAKVGDALPALAAPMPQPLPPYPTNGRLEEIFDSSTSTESTPYGSPLMMPTLEMDISQHPGLTSAAPHATTTTAPLTMGTFETTITNDHPR
ncbi:MAG: hypothetical protein M1827_000967 [Pycnora praestabilis]|nr:MAG: hypothetical protein M1827_000967 [Pycnora praestabilis]